MKNIDESVLNVLKCLRDFLIENKVDVNYGISRQDWFHDFSRNVKELGCEVLGTGHFSAAITHPSNSDLVIKIGFKKEDSGAAYAAFCRQFQGVYGVPKIYLLERFENFYVVIMKKYDSYLKGVEIEDTLNASFNYHPELNNLEIDYDLIKNYLDYNGYYNRRFENAKPKAELVFFAEEIKKFFTGLANFDLHSENIMYDKDLHQIVITDPVSFSKDRDVESIAEIEKKLELKINDTLFPEVKKKVEKSGREVSNSFCKEKSKKYYKRTRGICQTKIRVDEDFSGFINGKGRVERKRFLDGDFKVVDIPVVLRRPLIARKKDYLNYKIGRKL